MSEGPTGDHVFISYAWEDLPLAEWLTNKLIISGYKVWRDQIKMFGGESTTLDIDDAIKNQTHRLVAILSPDSLQKPNPTKERTLGVTLSRKWNVPFIIPISLGISPDELNWNISDLTYIDFKSNWAHGLNQLLKALAKSDTPRKLNNGPSIVTSSIIPEGLTLEQADTLTSNIFPVTNLPEVLFEIKTTKRLRGVGWDNVRKRWPAYSISYNRCLALSEPMEEDWKSTSVVVDAHRLEGRDVICGILLRNILKNLVKQCMRVKAIERGMETTPKGSWLHCPWSLIKGRRHSFVGLGSVKTNVALGGEKGFFTPGKGTEKYRYFLSPRFDVRDDLNSELAVQLSIGVHVTDVNGHLLIQRRTAQSRRKHATSDWWNDNWGNRHLALADFLAGGEKEIVYGNNKDRRYGQILWIGHDQAACCFSPSVNVTLAITS